ncbi:uncharacterized protein A4U43_C07F23590 [Asparagus officinalis]|uniref:MLO-like protein n=1 Tax=Asparagus officinalis TaxID=4686 RepID=A0A5P1EHS6_ASPOF|nr:MLO-like protein 9 [Asparagus officinalis]ONK64241.1 uncharacterized protein A4U43_C07F23590 [Asparagus officinalis]
MGGGGGGSENTSRELSITPTWAVAGVCAVIVLLSLLLETGLHRLGHYFVRRKKTHLNEALEKIKAELMLLGFISLLLTFGQNYISSVCIPVHVANTMLPCKAPEVKPVQLVVPGGDHAPAVTNEGHSRRLLSQMIMDLSSNRRVLTGDAPPHKCAAGKVPLISTDGLHQLHIFIFFLAVFHVLSCGITMALGRAKIRKWKDWEKETQSVDYEYATDQRRVRLTNDISFVRRHASLWSKMKFSIYFSSFFRQFFSSVRKVDYMCMRHGFISVHLAPGSKFHFQKYIKRSLEDDFKVVVGISPLLWVSAVIILLLNVNGWQLLMWISVMPLILILVVGTKLQSVIIKMALEIQERHTIVQGIPVVQLTDRHFWFGRPHVILRLIHFILFQNAFQLIYLVWIYYEFGPNSCFHDSRTLVIVRICFGIGVQVVCSYITLPLYALVSQMGAQMKRTIFDDQTATALKMWRRQARKHSKEEKDSPPRTPEPIISDPPQPDRSSPRRRRSVDQELPVTLDGVPSSTSQVDLLASSDQQTQVDAQSKDDGFYLVKI